MRNTDTRKAKLKYHELYLLRIDEYDKNPTKCKNCNKSLPYDKRKNIYCSHKCSAIINNSLGVPRNGQPLPYCKLCGKKLSRHNQQYCVKCRFLIMIRSYIKSNKYIDDQQIKKYLLLTREYICNNCKLTTWLGAPIPLETHHKDGDSTNNEEENLELLCKNCHAFTDTYGSKNKGKGRERRRERRIKLKK
jgi:hypothetical protein